MQKLNAKEIWISKITSKKQALEIIKGASYGYLAIAGIQIVFGYFVDTAAVIDGLIYAILALLLLKLKSRTIAILLVLFSGIALYATAINKFGAETGGHNMILAIIMLVVGIRATQATFQLNKKVK